MGREREDRVAGCGFAWIEMMFVGVDALHPSSIFLFFIARGKE